MSQTITVYNTADLNDSPELLEIAVRRALINITYAWADPNETDIIRRELKREQNSQDKFVTRIVSEFRRLSPSIDLTTALGSRRISRIYDDDMDTPFITRRSYLITRRTQDSQLNELRKVMSRIDGSSEGFQHVTQRSMNTARRVPIADLDSDPEMRRKLVADVRVSETSVSVVDASGRGSKHIELQHEMHGDKRIYTPLVAKGQDEYELRPSLTESQARNVEIKVKFERAAIESFKRRFEGERNRKKHANVQRRSAELTISNERIMELLAADTHTLTVSSGIRMPSIETDRHGITHDERPLNIVGSLEFTEPQYPMVNGDVIAFAGRYRLILKATVAASSGHALTLPNNGTMAYRASDLFLITVIPLNCHVPTLKPSGIPWIPEYILDGGDITDHESIMVCDIDGQKLDKDLSEKAARVDPWTQLPPPHDTLRKSVEKERDRIAPITKMGLELEDVESLLEKLPADDLKILRNVIIGGLLALFSGATLTDAELPGVYYQAALRYVTANAGPAVTHSGKVRTVAPESRGENTSSEAILARIVLSRLVTTVMDIDTNVEVPFHLWSQTNLQALKIPICLTKMGLLVYTADSVFNRLLLTSGESWAGKDSTVYSGFEPKVVGEIFSPLYRVKNEEGCRPEDFTHTLLDMDGTEYSLDGIIHDMGVICMNDANLSTGVGRALVWHPAFCIIMSVKRRRPRAVVIAGPRSSRLIRPYKNQSEILLGVDAGEALMHEATMITAKGYLSALMKHVKLKLETV